MARPVLGLSLLFLALAGADSADQWPAAESRKFIEDCTAGCLDAPNLREANRPICRPACECLAVEAQKIMTSADHAEWDAAAAAGKSTPKADQLSTHQSACIQQGRARVGR